MMIIPAIIATILVAPSQSHSWMDCIWEETFKHDYDSNFETPSDRFLSGLYAEYSYEYLDRKFRWKYCIPHGMSPLSPDNTLKIAPTSADQSELYWVRTCEAYNGGRSAISGIVSNYDNSPTKQYEYREFTIKCSNLDNQYQLTKCSWSDWLNGPDKDESIFYYCPNLGVIRGIQSEPTEYQSPYKDRRYKFECCTVEDISYSFDALKGYWQLIDNCDGCDSHTYTVTDGVEHSQTSSSSTTSAWSNTLASTISVGFEFEGFSASGSLSVSGEASQTVSRRMETSMTHSRTERKVKPCSNDNLFQWVITGTENSDGTEGQFSVWGVHTLCTDNYKPACPPEYCLPADTEDCTYCKAPFDNGPCGNYPVSCQGDIDWALSVGKVNYPEYYPQFQEVTGVQLTSATAEDMMLFWFCTNTNPNGNCAGLEIPCGRQCGIAASV